METCSDDSQDSSSERNNGNHDEDWSPILTPIFFYKLVEWTQGMFKPYLSTCWSTDNPWTSKRVNVIQELIKSFTGFYDCLAQNILKFCVAELKNFAYAHH